MAFNRYETIDITHQCTLLILWKVGNGDSMYHTLFCSNVFHHHCKLQWRTRPWLQAPVQVPPGKHSGNWLIIYLHYKTHSQEHSISQIIELKCLPFVKLFVILTICRQYLSNHFNPNHLYHQNIWWYISANFFNIC